MCVALPSVSTVLLSKMQLSYWFLFSNIDIMAEGSRQNRRYQQNLQGLLQLAVDAGSATEEPAPAEPMSEEVKSTLLNRLYK